MTATVIWGTDFLKGREPITDLTMLAADIVNQVSIPYEPPTSDEPIQSNGFDMKSEIQGDGVRGS